MTVAPLGPNDLLTLGGAAILITIIFKVVELAIGLTGEQKARFGPLISVGLGIVLVVGASVSLGQDIIAGFITGILAGATASGLYDVATSQTGGA